MCLNSGGGHPPTMNETSASPTGDTGSSIDEFSATRESDRDGKGRQFQVKSIQSTVEAHDPDNEPNIE